MRSRRVSHSHRSAARAPTGQGPVRPTVEDVTPLYLTSQWRDGRLPEVKASSALAPIAVQALPLNGPIADGAAQISAMAWYGDRLLLLPQMGEALYAIDKAEVRAHVDGAASSALTPHALAITPDDLAERFEGFEGFEALAIVGDRAFVLIEARVEHQMCAYLLAGTLTESGLHLDVSRVQTLTPDVEVNNLSFEALAVAGDRLLALPEAARSPLNPTPRALVFDFELNAHGSMPLPSTPYRITDATPVDEDGRFWVANYNHTGDPGLPAHTRVERLLPMRIEGDRIVNDGPALPLTLEWHQDARNWEAIAPFDERGLLVATDQFPTTILGFVPLSTPEPKPL